MANYEAKTLSSYFKVKDPEAFKDWFDGRSSELERWEKTSDDELLFGFGGYCSVPSDVFNEETEDYDEIDFFGELKNHLADDWGAIIQETGNEKLRYLVAYTWTITSEEVCSYDPMQIAVDTLRGSGTKCTTI
jgi:hypothetical protein